jgi:hypothetical protein
LRKAIKVENDKRAKHLNHGQSETRGKENAKIDRKSSQHLQRKRREFYPRNKNSMPFKRNV